MIWSEVICLGDSLTYGARDEYGRSYPAELEQILKERTSEYWFCHNYGINGETSSDVLRRCWRIFESHPKAKLMTFMIGTNDTKLPMPVKVYRDNLYQTIAAAHAHDLTVFIGTIPPIRFNTYFLRNKGYAERYTEVILQLAQELKLHVCDMSSLGDYLIDGVHFSHAGNVHIAHLWADKILSVS